MGRQDGQRGGGRDMVQLLLHVGTRHEGVGLDHCHRILVRHYHLVFRRLRGGSANRRGNLGLAAMCCALRVQSRQHAVGMRLSCVPRRSAVACCSGARPGSWRFLEASRRFQEARCMQDCLGSWRFQEASRNLPGTSRTAPLSCLPPSASRTATTSCS